MASSGEPDDRAREVTPAPTLRVVGGELDGTVIPLDEDAATLGRRENNAYVLSDLSVSRVHARLTQTAGSTILADLGSSGGTRVNDTPLEGSAVISHGDHVTFGSVTTVFEDPTAMTAAEEQTEVFAMPQVETGPQLSPREQQTLELIAEGLTNGEIGDRLGITERTVKAYASGLYKKLDVANRAAAVAEALKHDLLG